MTSEVKTLIYRSKLPSTTTKWHSSTAKLSNEPQHAATNGTDDGKSFTSIATPADAEHAPDGATTTRPGNANNTTNDLQPSSRQQSKYSSLSAAVNEKATKENLFIYYVFPVNVVKA